MNGAYKLVGLSLFSFLILSCSGSDQESNGEARSQLEQANTAKPVTISVPAEQLTKSETYFAQIQHEHLSELSFSISGQIDEVYVTEGDRVSAGSPLVRLHVPGMEERIEQLQASVERAGAQVEFLENELKRKQQLSDQAFIGESELERANEQLRVARSSLLEVIAERNAFERRAEERVLKAPYAGFVEDVLIEPGEQVSPMNPALLLSGGELEVEIRVSQGVIDANNVGDPVKLKLLDSDELINARIVSLGTGVTRNNQGAKVRLLLGPVHENKVGRSVAVSFVSNQAKGYKLPINALRTNYRGGNAQVLVRKNGESILTDVEILGLDGNYAYVAAGDGDELTVITQSAKE